MLYDLLSVGGFVIIDDYMSWSGCRQAVDDFRASRDILEPFYPVYHEGTGSEVVQGVWWQKKRA